MSLKCCFIWNGHGFKSRPGNRLSWHVFRGYCQSLQVNAKIAPCPPWPWLISLYFSSSFYIIHSPVDVIYSEPLTASVNRQHPRWMYRYFYVVARLEWSEDLESYSGGNLATGRGSHAGQVKGDDTNKQEYPSPLGWELGVGLTTPPCKTLFRNLNWSLGKEEEDWRGHDPKCHRRRRRNRPQSVYENISNKWAGHESEVFYMEGLTRRSPGHRRTRSSSASRILFPSMLSLSCALFITIRGMKPPIVAYLHLVVVVGLACSNEPES
jgi:hypothetical protein